MNALVKILLVVLITVMGGYHFHELSGLISPVASNGKSDGGRDFLRESLVYLRCPRHNILQIQSGIETASDSTGISRFLLASLFYTESNFRNSALSPKGYIGIAQTPYASIKYPEVDILHGAMILKDKIRIANGNIFRALALYKGGDNPVAKKQAKHVIQVYNRVIERIG